MTEGLERNVLKCPEKCFCGSTRIIEIEKQQENIKWFTRNNKIAFVAPWRGHLPFEKQWAM